MNEQPTNSANEVLENIADQNKKMRKKLITVVLIAIGIVVLLIGTLLIIKAVNDATATKAPIAKIADNIVFFI